MPLYFAKAAPETHHFPLTIRHLLDNVLTTAAEQRIIYRDKVSYTYRDLVGRVGKLASLLTELGVEAGETVAVMDWDSHRYLEAYFAVPMMGAVLQMVNVRLPAPQLTYTLQQAKARLLIVHHDFFGLVDAILPLLPDIKAVIAISDGQKGEIPPWAKGEYEQFLTAASPDFPFEDFDENAVATIFFTTGTTGKPKGVCFTHRQIVLQSLATAAAGAGRPGFAFDDVYMPLTPMFHVHAWGLPFVATMLGMKQVYPGRYEPDLICHLRQTHGVSFSHCVPTVVQMILDAADKNGADLSGWKVIIAGSALSRSLYDEGKRRGLHLFSAYGMSETAPLICMTRSRAEDEGDEDAMASTLLASGVPAPLVRARIVDEAMNDIPHNGATRGELVVRAPWLTPGYIGDDTASAALWSGGWLHTQDIATIDQHGYIRIRDRLKDIIKTGGEWIDSIHLEELIATAEGVAEASVIAVPDVRWGERPLAVVVVEPGASVELQTINAPIEEAISQGLVTRYAKIDHFRVVDRLPRTSVGKIDKKELRARFAAKDRLTQLPAA